MSLSNWAENGWLRPHKTSDEEIANLLSIVDRELRDATVAQISLDARLGMLYNAALKLADLPLRVAGYRATRDAAHHYRVVMSLPLTMGSEWNDAADFLDAVRVLRNRAEYESAGFATDTQLAELRDVAVKLRDAVNTRLRRR